MTMDGKAEIRVGVKLASTKADMKKQLKDLSSGLTINIKATNKGIQQTANNIKSTMNKSAKQSAQVFVEHFDRIGSDIKKTKTISAIQNMYVESNKNAKKSADVWKQSFKEIEQAASKAMAKNKQFNQWFMPQQGKNLPTASTSAFGLTQGEMHDRGKAFDSWFMPKSEIENIKSAKDSMSAFIKETEKGAIVKDRFGKTSVEATKNFKNMNKELINSTKNQFAFSNMLTTGIKKMLIWSNMVIMEIYFK